MFFSPFSAFETLESIPGLRHAITHREIEPCAAGKNRPDDAPFATLNLGYHVNDDPAAVSRNRRTIAEQLSYRAEALTTAQQVHGVTVHHVTGADRGRGALDWDSAIQATDALFTTAPETPLLILVADCAPLLLVDEANHALAVVHAGWRGAVGRIASRTIDRMKQECGTAPATVRAGIGPHLCPACFEIGPEVAEPAAALAPDAIVPAPSPGSSHPHLNLDAVLRADLASAGVLASSIETVPACPRCHNGRFFSHRGQNGRAGRFGLVAWWEG